MHAPTPPYRMLSQPTLLLLPVKVALHRAREQVTWGHGAPLLDGALQRLQRGGGRVRALCVGARLAHPGPRLQLDL